MTSRETGYAQILLTFAFLVGYFVVLNSFIQGKVTTPPEWKDTVQALIAVLTGGVLSILNYWFARQRQSSETP